MAKSSNFSILADVELDLTSIQQQLKRHKITFDIDRNSIKVAGASLGELTNQAKDASKATENLSNESKKLKDNTDDLALSVDASRKVLDLAIETISSMVTQVYNLDSALTEFKKVSELSGDSLDDYVDKLSSMGSAVARTGKPNRSEPVCRYGKAA